MTDMMISTPQRDVSKAVRMPVMYEEAVRDLIACQTLDEAKYFADKADALAAWAKIYKSDQAGVEAKRLKLHAYRRMGSLAAELRPQERKRRLDGKIMGKKDGPASLLREQGIDGGREFAAMKLSRLSGTEFQGLIDSRRIPAPMAAFRSIGIGSVEMSTLMSAASTFRTACRKVVPDMFASAVTTAAQRDMFVELLEWLDRLDQCFPDDRTEHG